MIQNSTGMPNFSCFIGKNQTFRLLVGSVFMFFGFVLHSQELPPIVNYPTKTYGGGNQNWAISQDADKFIYVGNNEGLLEFNGAKWQLYPSPNKTIIRSVFAKGDRIYTGSYRDFGFWERHSTGALAYTSLSEKLSLQLVEDEHFWNIIAYGHWVLFQSLDRIYMYNAQTGQASFIEAGSTLTKVFKLGNAIYYHVLNEGLFTIENGSGKQLSAAAVFKDDRLIQLFELGGTTYAVTQKNGVYALANNLPTPWDVPANNILKKVSVYSGIQLQDGSIMLGTIANGVYHISSKGEVLFQINQYNGLGNNTALTLFEDFENNVWVGLDNGIDCINIEAAYTNYVDQAGSLGTVYAAAQFRDNLYLGTNQGLFVREMASKQDFKLIANTQGQVWNLKKIDGQLFCGHNSGTFLIEGHNALKTAEVAGTWDIKKIEGRDDLLLQGNYTGLYVLKNTNGSWELRNKLEGFDISSRYFEITAAQDKIIVNHEYKGVYEL
ncbi:MAG: hypothetical protein ACPGQR_04955, partial [Marinirhabdus sp.]